jgi:diguanylate cyclase (GGDEF)-like protein
MMDPSPTSPEAPSPRLSDVRPPSEAQRPAPRSVIAVWAAFSVVVIGALLATSVMPHAAGLAWLWGSIAIVLCGLAARVRDLERYIRERQVVLEGQHELLHRAALTDPMTGLPNRRHLMERFDQEVARAKRHGLGLACLFLDVDNFAEINNTYLHEAGDAILASLGGVLRRQLRAGDVLGRYGGDEFLILLPGVDPTRVAQVAERIRASVERHRFRALPPHEGVTVSIGAALWSLDTHEQPDALVRAADEALYRAKEEGRNTVSLNVSLAEAVASGRVVSHDLDSRDERDGGSRAASGRVEQ